MLVPVLAAILAMDIRAAVAKGSGVIDLPAGETHLNRPLEIRKGAKAVTIRGNTLGSVLVMDASFQGSAAIVADGISGLNLLNFAIRGNRTSMKSPWYLPLREAAFADFYPENGIVVRNSQHILVGGVHFTGIKTFPLIVNASSDVTIYSMMIEDCGTLNAAGRNNTSGGILLEEGVSRFEVRDSTIRRVTGNAIWTHSYARSPRSSDGRIRGNTISIVGRDAIQTGHATRVTVEGNRGTQLGFPAEYVDVESHGVAVALDTAGNVDQSVYASNHFTDVNGQCIDLDGFHDGSVTGNSCINKRGIEAYPALHYGIVFGNNDPGVDAGHVVVSGNSLEGFAYGALFLLGVHNRVEKNRFRNMNLARCGTVPVSAQCNYGLDQPDLLRSGIYLSLNGGRPATTRENVIRDNVVQGYGMKTHCIAFARGVERGQNTIERNSCSD